MRSRHNNMICLFNFNVKGGIFKTNNLLEDEDRTRNRVSQMFGSDYAFVVSVGFLMCFLFMPSHQKQYIYAGTTLNHDKITSILLDMMIRRYSSEDESMLSEDEGAQRKQYIRLLEGRYF